MSETASKVGVAYAGDSVTVQMSYAEGWTKVTWKDKEGYVKTEFLKNNKQMEVLGPPLFFTLQEIAFL